ncbi:MAG: TadE family protein [Eubacterium sp.]
MLKKLKINRKSNRKEEGQSMIEFAFVLPVFMLLIVIILDYGWLFYNQIQLENCARNAARVACVEYKDTCLDPLTGEAYATGAKQKFALSRLDTSESQSTDPLTDQEKDILNEVKRTLPSSVSNVEVYIEYTYDGDYLDGTYATFDVRNRSKGDVCVQVKGVHSAISPLVGWGSSGGDYMHRPVSCKSVYKVEKMEKVS